MSAVVVVMLAVGVYYYSLFFSPAVCLVSWLMAVFFLLFYFSDF